MNITTDDIYSLVLKYKKKKNQQEKNYEKEKILISDSILTSGIIMNNSNISSIKFNSIDKNIIFNFQNLEYLSLKNNSLRNIDFIIKLPNLFYLDLFQNSIEDFSSLLIKNTFGYLRITIDAFNEKKILTLRNLTINIFELQIHDQKLLKHLIYHNPNITLLNNKLNYMIDVINRKERRSSISTNNPIQKDSNNSRNEYRRKTHSKKLTIYNESLINIIKFYDKYNQTIKKIINVMEINTSSELKICKEYIKLEKKKLLLLCQTYIKLLNYNEKMDSFYINSQSNIDSDLNLHQFKLLSISHIFKINKVEDSSNLNDSDRIRNGIIILTSILMLILNVISENLCISLLNFMFENHYHYKVKNLIPENLKINSIHLLPIYFFLYDNFVNELTKIKINNNFYEKLIEIISMDKLILKGNDLIKIFIEFNTEKKHYNKVLLIKEKINFIKQLDIYEDFLILLQFFSDFIVYEKISDNFLNENLSIEYSDFIQFKEIIEKLETENSNLISLSDKKFQRNNLETLTNKFFFMQKKIELLKKKLYPLKKKRSLPKIKFINYDDDYEIVDDIETKPFFQIKNIKKNIELPITNYVSTSQNTNRLITDYNNITNSDNKNLHNVSSSYFRNSNTSKFDNNYRTFFINMNSPVNYSNSKNKNKLFNRLKNLSNDKRKNYSNYINDFSTNKTQFNFKNTFKGKAIRLNHPGRNLKYDLDIQKTNNNEQEKKLNLNNLFFVTTFDTEFLRNKIHKRINSRPNHLSFDKRFTLLKS